MHNKNGGVWMTVKDRIFITIINVVITIIGMVITGFQTKRILNLARIRAAIICILVIFGYLLTSINIIQTHKK
jgi:hypothetical protein